MTALNAAAAIFLGSATASRVYLGANLLWPPGPIPYPDIAMLDSTSNSFNGTGTGTATVTLPASSAVGQYCLALISNDYNVYPAVPSGWTLIAQAISVADEQDWMLVGKFLDAADVGAGSVAFVYGGTHGGLYVGISATFSNVDSSAPIGVTSENSSSVNNPPPVEITATGVTTVFNNALLVAVFGMDARSNTQPDVLTTPSGWTAIRSQNTNGWSATLMAMKPHPVAGATGDVVATDTVNSGGWGALMVSLTKNGPHHMVLLGDLPNATNGAAYSARLTFGGDFVTPVIAGLQSGSLPAWMTATADATGITYSGTPSAVASAVSFTPKATDSSGTPQVAVGAAQSVAVVTNAVTYATWDAAGSGYGNTLSNGNLTVSCGDSNGGVTTPTASGVTTAAAANYYECTLTAKPGGGTAYIGFGNSSFGNGTIPGGAYADPETAFGVSSAGDMLYSQGNKGNCGLTFATGDTMKLLLAPGGGVYVGKVGAGWAAGHDPTLSQSPSFTLATGTWRPSAGGQMAGSQGVVLTANFGASAWLEEPPAGAAGWTV